jgi:hypothetical protein
MAIETMRKVIASTEYDMSRDVRTLNFADATALYVSGESLRRRGVVEGGDDEAFYIPGCTAVMELVDGRWTLAKLIRPRTA